MKLFGQVINGFHKYFACHSKEQLFNGGHYATEIGFVWEFTDAELAYLNVSYL